MCLIVDEEAVDPKGLEGKAPLVVEQKRQRAIEDTAIVCRFSRSK